MSSRCLTSLSTSLIQHNCAHGLPMAPMASFSLRVTPQTHVPSCIASRPHRASRCSHVRPLNYVGPKEAINRLLRRKPSSKQQVDSQDPVSGVVDNTPQAATSDSSNGNGSSENGKGRQQVDTVQLREVLEDTAASAVVGQPLGRVAKTYRAERWGLQQKAGRKLFYPTKRTLEYLDGSLPGDYGWDPLGLADPKVQGDSDTMNLAWLSYAELIHGRWAMLAALGALAPELMSRTGAIPPETGLPWFVAGGLFSDKPGVPAIPFIGSVPFSYWGDNFTLAFTGAVTMAFVETARYMDWKSPGSVGRMFKGLEGPLRAEPHDPKYPGGPVFNFAKFGERKAGEMEVLRTKEIKNGRLAMVAWLGFMVQAVVTREGPVQNLLDHVADPANRNLLANVGSFITTHSSRELFPFVIWLVAGYAAGALYSYSLDHEARYTGVAEGQNPVNLPGPHDSVSGAKDNMGAAVGARDEATFNEQKTRWPQVDGARDKASAEKGIAAKREVTAQQAEGALGEGGSKGPAPGKEAAQQEKAAE